MDSEHHDESQPREHRAGAWILLIVGVAAFGLGIFQFRESVVAPFAVKSQFKTQEQKEQERLDELKMKDTDQDGITDFDESYVFNTSPYLEDSDSDGMSDKEELESGRDPNCPEGKECGPLGDSFATTEDAFGTEPSVDSEEAQTELIDAMLNPSPEQIRKLLIDSGVSKEEVDALDDDTLTALYQESLKEVQAESPSLP